MIDPDMRHAIYQLHQAGMSLREISRRLHVSRSAVRGIVQEQGKFTRKERKDKLQIDPQLIERLYRECNGWIQRIHEKLREEENIEVGYSTLTRMLRDLGLSRGEAVRCDRVPDEPGAEMQHDTTVYLVALADKRTKLIASLLYLRYSKRLMDWGYAARQCIIDNTNLARLRGAGSRAVMVPEMAAFSRRYGFQFACHAINHANRKAGNERSFRTVETSFLPGRTFDSLEDLNRQARQWATERMESRPQGKARLVPAKMFEHERHYLNPLPPHLPAPYQVHQRGTDQYGYVALGANYYWVPGSRRDEVKVLEYADRLKIFLRHVLLAEYPLPADGVRLQYYSPPGQGKPRHQPKNRRRDARQEEQRLRALGEEVVAYLDYALAAPGIQRHRFTRELFALSRKMTCRVFINTVQRALRYRIVDLATLRRIAWLCTSQADEVLPEAEVDEDFQQRPAYQEGCLTDLPDLSVYDQLGEEENDDQKQEEENKENEDGDPPW
jgi:transposase